MIKVKIDNKIYSAKDGETILKVCKDNGISIPTLCHLKGLNPTSNCRICLVEIEGKSGLVTACSFKCYDGISVITNSKKVIDARRTNLELLLSNHNYDCDNCTRNGECALQNLTKEYNANPNRFKGEKTKALKDFSSPALMRDNSKCILCKKCVSVCGKKQTVNAISSVNRGFNTAIGTAFNEGIDSTKCVACGQCVLVCPTGALTENFNIKEVEQVLKQKDKYVVVAPAPSVRVALGDEFGLKSGNNVESILPSILRELGFDKVFDITFCADLTIMEESKEFISRLKTNKNLPLFTSCCPAWVDFVKKFYPELEKNISSTKSPQEMFGAVVKSYYANKMGINPKDIVVVTIMPCTAKKKELHIRKTGDIQDVDYSLTVRELAHIIKAKKIDIKKLKPSKFDQIMGTSSGAGVIFGTSGGVMEAALRTIADTLENKSLTEVEYGVVRGLSGVKLASVVINKKTINVAVVSGLNNARKLIEKIKAKELNLDFVEVMSCEGGCINGGGMPRKDFNSTVESLESRKDALYKIDRQNSIRKSYENPMIKEFYLWQSTAKNKAVLHTK